MCQLCLAPCILFFFFFSLSLNPGPHVCKTSILLNKLSAQSSMIPGARAVACTTTPDFSFCSCTQTQPSPCLSLLSARITVLHHYTLLPSSFSFRPVLASTPSEGYLHEQLHPAMWLLCQVCIVILKKGSPGMNRKLKITQDQFRDGACLPFCSLSPRACKNCCCSTAGLGWLLVKL